MIERAGQPLAALVPLADLALVDPDRRRAARLAALDDIRQLARRRPFPPSFDPVAVLHEQRRARAGTGPDARPDPKAFG